MGRKKSRQFDDPSSNSTMELSKVTKHFIARFTRFLRLLGIIQRISEEEGIARDRIVQPGPAGYQDRSSGQGHAIHRAHVIRGGRVNGDLSPANQRELIDQLGHTHEVRSEANFWRGIGGEIDTFQEHFFRHRMYNLNFENSNNHDSIQQLLNEYISILEEFIKNTQGREQLREDIRVAVKVLRNITLEDLRLRGVRGYLKTYEQINISADEDIVSNESSAEEESSECSDHENNWSNESSDDEEYGSTGYQNNASSSTSSANSYTSSSPTSGSNNSSSSSTSPNRNKNTTSFADVAVPLAVCGLAVAGTAAVFALAPAAGPVVAAKVAGPAAATVVSEAVIAQAAVGLGALALFGGRRRNRR